MPGLISIEEAQPVSASQAYRRLDTFITDLDLKGGLAPNLYVTDKQPVQFVYLLGTDRAIEVDATVADNFVTRTSVIDTGVSLTPTTAVNGSALTIPDGASQISWYVRCTTAPAGAATVTVGVFFSNDGVTFFGSPNDGGGVHQFNITISALNEAFTSANTNTGKTGTVLVPQAMAKYARLTFYNNTAVNTPVVQSMLVTA